MQIKAPLTADYLWHVHRAALGGRSSVTGAELPQTLAGCPPGARGAHYAMALAAAWHVDPRAKVPVPAGVSPDEATQMEMIVAEILGEERRVPRHILETTLRFDDGTEETVDLSDVPHEEQQRAIDAAARGRRFVYGTSRAYTKTEDAPGHQAS